MTLRALCVLATVSAFVGCVDVPDGPSGSAPLIGSDTDLRPFIGSRAGQAENGLQNLGYQLARTEGLTAYWYNASTSVCAQIVTSDGRYSAINMIPAGQC